VLENHKCKGYETGMVWAKGYKSCAVMWVSITSIHSFFKHEIVMKSETCQDSVATTVLENEKRVGYMKDDRAMKDCRRLNVK
jgi:hypothetical protein